MTDPDRRWKFLPDFLGGVPNPQFVEWLMGFQIGHTASGPSETR